MAKKPDITTIASGYYSRQALNSNFENLQAGFDNTLSLDGSTPNAMGADFDVNGNNILNAGQIDTDTLLIGGVAVAPGGDVNFETTYLTASYVGDGSTVAYSLTANPQTENNVNIYVDGVYQNKDTFALSGTTVTFSEAPPLNAAIEIVYPTNTDTLNGSAASAITYNQGGTGAQDRTVEAKLQETVSVKDFGAVGDGVTDDTAAIQAAIDYAKANGNLIVGSAGDEYRTTSSLWFGQDNGNSTAYFQSNGSYIVADFNNAPVVDLTGIQNGYRYPWDIRIKTASGKTPSYGILQARPKQASGVKSSGNINLYAYVTGEYLAAAYCSVQSESNNLTGCFFNNNRGIAAAWVKEDYFKDTFTLNVGSASGSFTLGETITGGTSGATATVLRSDTSVTILFCRKISGTFTDGETVTGGTSGETATTSLALGYNVVGVASPNTALGVEETSTSTFQTINDCWFNNGSSNNSLPTVLVRDFSNVCFYGGNFNHSSTSGDLVHLQKDCGGLSMYHPFLHSTHRYSIFMGDETITSGSQSMANINFLPSVAGFTTDRLKTANSTVQLFDVTMTIVGEMNIGSSPMQGNNHIILRSKAGTGGTAEFTASGIIEGIITADQDTVFNITSSTTANRAIINYVDLGLQSVPRREAVTIASGAITASRNIVLVDTESSAATDTLTDINLPTNVQANGQVIYLRCLNASRVTTIATSGNIRGTSVDLDSTTKFVGLIYDEENSLWYIL